jgi:NnrU protein
MVLLVTACVPSRIRAAVRHPMLIAVMLWSLAHLLADGDLASVLLFGSFLAYGVTDMISANQRAALAVPRGVAGGGRCGHCRWTRALCAPPGLAHHKLTCVPLLPQGMPLSCSISSLLVRLKAMIQHRSNQ